MKKSSVSKYDIVPAVLNKYEQFFYVHGSVHRESILITVQRDATVCSLFLFYYKITLHVSGINHTHHQEYMKL
jgi:hypothetical protein